MTQQRSRHQRRFSEPSPSGATVIEVEDPDTGKIIGAVHVTASDDLDNLLNNAKQALHKQANHSDRSAALTSAADTITANREEFVTTLTAEGIKTISEAQIEVDRAAATLRSYAHLASATAPETPHVRAEHLGPGANTTIETMPSGVVVAITPFNDPLNLVAHKLGAAVAAGCPIIVKPHEATPLVADLLIRSTDWTALPTGYVQIAHGYGADVGAKLVADPRVKIVSFTGGVETGTAIARTAGLKQLVFELGGNCPTLVWADADLHIALPALRAGIIAAAGQNCLHVQRIYVHAEQAERASSWLSASLDDVQLGPKADPSTDMGPLLNFQAVDRVDGLVKSAIQDGARLLAGGRRTGRTGYAPTLLSNVAADHPLSTTEVFGPITTINEIASLDGAIDAMNHTNTPLQAGVFTQDPHVARTSESKLRFGTVLLNRTSDFRIDTLPFGGPHLAGIGREGGRWGIEQLTEPKVLLRHTLDHA